MSDVNAERRCKQLILLPLLTLSIFAAEFDFDWPSAEPDLRVLIAKAQDTTPDLEQRPSCAVVGNSGRLLQHAHGAEIDERELVIRFNWGKVSSQPFLPYVFSGDQKIRRVAFCGSLRTYEK